MEEPQQTSLFDLLAIILSSTSSEQYVRRSRNNRDALNENEKLFLVNVVYLHSVCFEFANLLLF